MQIVRDGPAHRAGLKGVKRDRRGDVVFGDVITKLGDHTIVTNDDLLSALEAYKPGDVVTIESQRDGESKSFQVRLAKSK